MARPTGRGRRTALALGIAALALATMGAAARRWGADGHRLTARAALRALPAGMPAFFTDAADELVWLNPDPDRWRDRAEGALDPALGGHHAPEHYIDLEQTTPGSLLAPDRVAFIDSLRAAGRPEVPGVVPWRILELTQRVRSQFRAWRRMPDGPERRFLERRIINDAGVLGHYVADAANPHHTTIHHNGWVGPNPDGFATDPRTHGRFESEYVRTHMSDADLAPRVPPEARVHRDTRQAVWAHVLASHAQLRRLYELDRAEPFGAATQGTDHRAFAADRLAAGATMLRDLWWTAWVMSGEPDPPPPARP